MAEKYVPSKADYIDLKGKKYLPARRRVQWMRGDHPDWGINTDIIRLDWEEGIAVVRAEVTDETGRLIGAGTKTETRKGFPDFLEKAETGAIGRAVAIAGYGTEDALDLDEGERITDSPVAPPPRRLPPPDPTDAMRARLVDVAVEHGVDHKRLSELATQVGVPLGKKADLAQLQAIIDLILPDDMEQVLAAAGPGAEEVSNVTVMMAPPPKPATPEYDALPSGVDRATARAYWESRDTPAG